MTYPEDLVLEDDLGAAVRDRDAPEGDAAEQARPLSYDDAPHERFSPGHDVPEADAAEQAHEVRQQDDDYR